MAEVMDCFDFNQLQPNQSQDQCGFASVALCFAAGQPGHGPRQPVQWAIEKMASWYTEYDGPDIPSNTRGMSLDQLYKLIVEKGGHYQAIDANAASIASWIAAKYPVIIAVNEGSVFDVHLNACPYTWDTSGLSHIFTVTGIDVGHIFLCRDTVNQRDGSPYSYDGDKLSYLSATVFVPDWLPRPTSGIAPQGDEIVKILTIAEVSYFFEEQDATHWLCKQTGHTLKEGMLAFYKGYSGVALCGLTWIGLPKTDEIKIEEWRPPLFVKYKDRGITIQFCECGVLCYDPGHLVDQRPGLEGPVYLLQLYNDGPGQDPGIPKLQTAVTDLTTANNMQAQKITDLQQGQTIHPQLLPDMQQIRTISGKY